MTNSFQILLLLFLNNFLSVLAGTQSFRAVGQLLCRGKPAQFAELQLLNTRGGDKEYNIIIQKGVFSDADGYFEIYGNMHQFYEIPAALQVFHECFYDIGIYHGLCKNKFSVNFPEGYGNDGPLARITWDTGIINLELGVLGQNLEKCD
ncbi:CRE-TTR-55 protein [Caenorhabditis remanei]|uniref:CRE-TTR-55 protein n=1 Tax=Caenorhabditis remanei TaxID=31234 RepID=E3LMH9_CAERE|nr:CRE-TTR-55 protein [Caenorhabditis remanei]